MKLEKKLNIVFAGTPEFAAVILQSLFDQDNPNYNLSAIYTQPDRQAGRGRKVMPSAVKELLISSDNSIYNSIPIEQPDNFKKANPEYNNHINKLKSYQPDLIIVVAYGLILPQAVLDIPKYGCINIHASILPRWRGAAPIQRAILAGDTESGVSIQQMDKGLDTGDVIAESKCPITNADTSITLSNKLLDLTMPLLQQVINNIINNNITLTKQDDSFATYAHKIDKSESIIDLSHDAVEIDRQIRAFMPWPGAQIKINSDLSIKIYEAKPIVIPQDNNTPEVGSIIEANKKAIIIQCGKNQLQITKLQFSGGKVITAADALNGKYKNLFSIGGKL